MSMAYVHGHSSSSPAVSFDGQCATLVSLLRRLPEAIGDVIGWGCPVISFGDISSSRVATLGLNPSNREFVDSGGQELSGRERRFPTLSSLGIRTWAEAEPDHVSSILHACRSYFSANPYDAWFGRLEQIVGGIGASFYGPRANACHLDLVPYATTSKWIELDVRQRVRLLDLGAASLPGLLRASPVKVLVLNGQTVVDHFGQVADAVLERVAIPSADLQRKSSSSVKAYGYIGRVHRIAGMPLEDELTVVGYNHNIQSSFGVTREAILALRNWVAEVVQTS